MKVQALKNKYLTGEFLLKREFSAKSAEREDVITRCEQYAGWTLPIVFPDADVVETDEMQHDYQSVGAQAVTNLANKIMMTLFQPSKPFFRTQLSDEQRAEVAAEEQLSSAQIDAALAQTEREGMKELDKMHIRVSMNSVIPQLIITGNSLLHTPENKPAQVYSLRDYVMSRNLSGEPTKTIVREEITVSGLDEELEALATVHGYHENDKVSLYTGIQKVGEERYVVWQELEDICYCHKQIGVYSKDTLPWIPLTWNLTRGKDYGTGLVENYAGDFHTLSTLAETSRDYAIVITDIKNLVDPTGMTDVREITEAPSGAYVHGREGDIYVHTPQVANAADFLDTRFDKVARRIGAAFLLNTAVTRDAERVTAAEIRMQAQELEGSLGGVYTRLATELQLPLAKRLLRKVDKTFTVVEPVIVTGFESLSRNSELDNFRAFMQDLIILADVPEEVRDRMKFGDVIATLGAGHGVAYENFLKDEDVVKQERKERAAQEAEAAGMQVKAEESNKQGQETQ